MYSAADRYTPFVTRSKVSSIQLPSHPRRGEALHRLEHQARVLDEWRQPLPLAQRSRLRAEGLAVVPDNLVQDDIGGRARPVFR